jgi:nitroreductase
MPLSEKDVFAAINARRSVRRYNGRTIDADTVASLLEAAVRAPTAMHEEPWGFVIVQDKKLLNRLADKAKVDFIANVLHNHSKDSARIAETFSSPDFHIFYHTTTLIIICAKHDGNFVAADCWLSAENLMLAACSMGLGTCVIGSAIDTLNLPEVKAQLGISDNYTVVVPLIVGYPSGDTPLSARNKPTVLQWLKDPDEAAAGG